MEKRSLRCDLHFWPTPNGKKVTILLEELGLDYNLVPCSIGRGDQFKPEFLKINPNHPPSQTRWAGSTAFAEPVFADAEVVASAKTAASQNESEVFLLSCITKNNTIASGCYFHIEKDKNFDPNDTTKKSFVDIVDHCCPVKIRINSIA